VRPPVAGDWTADEMSCPPRRPFGLRQRLAVVGERDKLGEARGAGRLTRPLGESLAAASSGGGVGGRGVAGEGFGAGSGVALEGAHGGVSGPSEQHRGVGAALGIVGKRGMA
jgi:hypothetical protein